MGVGGSRHLKEELAWAIDKWLQVISNKEILFNFIACSFVIKWMYRLLSLKPTSQS